MKKKLLALSICLSVLAVAMAGCGENDKEEETTVNETANDTANKVKTELKYSIEKSDYFGLEIEESDANLTDEKLQEYIDSDLAANYTEVKEGVVEEGMVIGVDYEGKVGDEVFDSAKDKELKLKKGNYTIDGFIQGIIGKSVGEEFELNLTFPKDYTDEDYAGKDIVFKVKIISIHQPAVLTDDYVKDVYSYLGISTVEEYKEEYRATIILQNMYKVLWPVVLENVVVESYDSEEMDSYVTKYMESLEKSVSSYGMDMAAYLEYMGMTEDELITEYEKAYKDETKYYLIRDYIAEQEGLSISDEEYTEELKKTMVAYDFETEEEFYKYFATYGYDEEYFRDNFLTNKVVEFICDNAVIVPDVIEKETETETAVE